MAGFEGIFLNLYTSTGQFVHSSLEMMVERMKVRESKPEVDEGSCIGCGICADNCPFDAIRVEDKAKISGIKCKSCGICARVCPQNAISLQRTRSFKFGSSGERLKSLRKRAEKLGKGLEEVEKELRKLIEEPTSCSRTEGSCLC